MRPQTKPHKKTNETLSYPSSPMYEVVSQTRETVFIGTSKHQEEKKLRRAAESYYWAKFEKFGEKVKHCLESVDIFFFNRNKK